MSPNKTGLISRAWFRWKTLRLPWRRRFLVGFDLEGYTYWEFKPRGGERWRRIVEYPRSTHYSQVRVSPLWHQWLRYTRDEPPTMQEQQTNAMRQERIKHLAAEANARWEAKPRLTDAPGAATGQRAPALGSASDVRDVSTEPVASTAENAEDTRTTPAKAEDMPQKADPWAQARAQGPSEKWQPAAWTPSSPRK